MTRRIVRDIEVKKTIRPYMVDESSNLNMSEGGRTNNGEKKVEKGNHKKSPYILDLSQETVVNSSVNLMDQGDLTDIHSQKKDPGIIVMQKKNKSSMFLQLSWVGVLGLFIIFLLNTAKGYAAGEKLFAHIADSAKQGYGQLVSGTKEVKNQNTPGAENMFEEAYVQFQSAQDQIWFMKNEPTLSKYTAVLESGQLLADSGKQMIEVMQEVKNIPDVFAKNVNQVNEVGDTKTALSELKSIYPKVVNIHSNIVTALHNFQTLENDVPAQYKAVFSKGIEVLTTSEKLLREIVDMIPGFEEMLGNGKPHRTLVLLQNNDEVRATGGFIGSFINLQMENGHVTSLKLEDVYDMDGQFKTKVEPPEDIKRITSSWFFRDSNFSPDFRVSGEKALWFYAQEKGETADTVLAMNQDFLGSILKITGPIEVPGLSSPLTAENYKEALTYMIETKRSGAADPKKILKDLMPLVQRRLFQPANMAQFQHYLLSEIVQKDIVGYSKNPLTQHFFRALGMDGVVTPEVREEDYLAIIASSFGGNKSDAYIKQDIQHDTVIERDGEIYDQLTITRTHQWSGATEQKWKQLLKPFGFTDFPEHWLKIFGKSDNKVALRVYAPSGSQLISSDSPAIEKITTMRDPDLNRSYFSFDMITKPGETTTAKFRYKLPFSLGNLLANTYTMNLQKQLGARASTFTKHILFNDFMSFAKAYPDDFIMENDGSLMIGKPLNRDLRLSLLMTRDGLKK